MTHREREHARLREIAERHPSPVRAVAAVVLLHERVDEPRQAAWRCACRHQPALGDSHAEHVAQAIWDLQRRRRWLR